MRNRLDMEKVEQAPEALHKVVSSIFIFDHSTYACLDATAFKCSLSLVIST